MPRVSLFACIVLAILSICLSGCFFVALVDNRDCSDTSLDELYEKPYQLTRLENGARDERGFSFDLRGDCTLVIPDSVRDLGVGSIELKNAHSAKRATLVIHTDSEDAEGEPLRCTAPFSTYRSMDFICPPELGKRSYRLAPLDIRE